MSAFLLDCFEFVSVHFSHDLQFFTDEKSNGKVVSFMKSTLQKVIFKHEVRYSYYRIDFQEDNELHPPYLANRKLKLQY